MRVNGAQGSRVVLTADRTLTAGYRLLFDGMLAACQTSAIPPAALAGLLLPRGHGRVAPMGLRRIEAALLRGGFDETEVQFAEDAALAGAIGPATRVIGISAGEPTGRGMNSNTMTGVAGGRIWPEYYFKTLLRQVKRLRAERAPEARIVLGGPGAWQLAGDEAARRELGIDHVVTGYAEGNAAEIFKALAEGQALPPVIEGRGVAPEAAPPIRRPSTMGVVEISRGCGLGCGFCTIARTPMIHLPLETILSDVRTNVAGGNPNIALLSEDFFRYGASGVKTNPDALIGLLAAIRKIEGVGLIQIDHVNVISIAQYSDAELRRVRELLDGGLDCRHPWVNIGIESASGELLQSCGGGPKMGRDRERDWGAFCSEQLRRLCRAGFLPMASLILGLPGEREADLQKTLAWVEGLRGEAVTVFPMLHAPIDGSAPPAMGALGRLHWRIIRESYKFNFKWIPRMYWHSQRAAGVSAGRRLLLQAMGWGQVLQWNAIFAYRNWRAAR